MEAPLQYNNLEGYYIIDSEQDSMAVCLVQCECGQGAGPLGYIYTVLNWSWHRTSPQEHTDAVTNGL